MKPTYNQLAASLILIICILCLVFKQNLDATTKQAIIGIATLSGGYLFGSTVGSHAKDAASADTLNNAINSLQSKNN